MVGEFATQVPPGAPISFHMHLLVALVGVELLEPLPRLRLSPLRPTLDHEVKQVGRPASPCARPDAGR